MRNSKDCHLDLLFLYQDFHHMKSTENREQMYQQFGSLSFKIVEPCDYFGFRGPIHPPHT